MPISDRSCYQLRGVARSFGDMFQSPTWTKSAKIDMTGQKSTQQQRLSESFKQALMSEMERIVCEKQRASNHRPVPVAKAIDALCTQMRVSHRIAIGALWRLIREERLKLHDDMQAVTTTQKTRYCPTTTARNLVRIQRPRP